MPRLARIDHPGLLHHVMVRGLNRQRLFFGAADYEDFLGRVAQAIERRPCEILAWALMPNHIHFLIRSGVHGMAPFLRRVLTGYALRFNRIHRRVGYLYQGRYKSLVCDEEEYLLVLLRYIHLNPVAAGLVHSVAALRQYPYTGHSVLMGKRTASWQPVDDVLSRFGKRAGLARQRYEAFLRDGIAEAKKKRTDLLGGGFVEGLKAAARHYRREGDRALYDARILGDHDFVGQVWKEAERRDDERLRLKQKKVTVRAAAGHAAGLYGIQERQLFEKGRTRDVSAAKAALIFIGVEYLGKSSAEMAALTRMSGAAASRARERAQKCREDLKIEKLIS